MIQETREKALLLVIEHSKKKHDRWELFAKASYVGLLECSKESRIEFWKREALASGFPLAISQNKLHPREIPWEIPKQYLLTKWKAALKGWPKIRSNEEFPEVDEEIIEMTLRAYPFKHVFSCQTKRALPPIERRWFYSRCSQLGIKSTKEGKSGDRGSHKLNVEFPGEWHWPQSPGEIVYTDKDRYRSERRRRMNEWRTDCYECGAELDAYHALYHWSGMGPLCEDCINADPELEGLKWEEKASFWV